MGRVVPAVDSAGTSLVLFRFLVLEAVAGAAGKVFQDGGLAGSGTGCFTRRARLSLQAMAG